MNNSLDNDFSAVDIARYIIDRRNKQNNSISNLPLNCLIVIMKRIALERGIEFLPFTYFQYMGLWGVGVSEVYWEYCAFGSFGIWDIKNLDVEPADKIPEEYHDFLNEIIDKYNNDWKLFQLNGLNQGWKDVDFSSKTKYDIIKDQTILKFDVSQYDTI